ncbi:MAG: ATP-binding protein [Actinomycetota bacterium]
MSERTMRILAWAIFLAACVGVVQQGWFEWQLRGIAHGEAWEGDSSLVQSVLFVALILSFILTGLLITLRRSRNPLGWLLLTIGAIFALGLTSYGRYSILVHALPLGRLALAFDQWTWIPAVGLLGTYTLFLFPDGHLPSPRWRWLAWLTTATLVVSSVAILMSPDPIRVSSRISIDNPFAIASLSPVARALQFTFLLIPICIIASAASLVVRYRRSRGVERQQIKWLAFAAGAVASLYLFVMFASLPYASSTATQPPWLDILQVYTVYTFALIPISIGFAVLRYRLWDIDLVISKTVVAGLLVAFITVVYVGLVVGLGALVGNPRDPTLSIAATAVVALLFGPVRERVRRFANRLVYGKRATPYEVMAGFAHRVSGSVSIEDVLPEMAEVAARGVGARAARVRVALPGGAERSRTWPEDAEADDGFNRSLEVVYQGEAIGAIDVAMPPDVPLRPGEERLLGDLAAQAGLALHNVRLTEELAIRAAELAVQAEGLRVSRERLVTARDAQRRGLERDIREGPERQLREIRGELDTVAVEDPGTAERLDGLTARANDTLEGLRDLARGIFPPLLADKGVVAALEAHVRKVGANAGVRATTPFAGRRFDADVEACLYFCCLQAIQNVMRHAGNTGCIVELGVDREEIRFSLSDRGPGFDPRATPRGMGLDIMQDRIDALEGTLVVTSAPGAGTTIAGTVPIEVPGSFAS